MLAFFFFFLSLSMHSASSYINKKQQQRGACLNGTPSLPDSLTYPSSVCCLPSKPGTAQVSGFPFPPLSLPTAHAPLSNLEAAAPGLSAPVSGRRKETPRRPVPCPPAPRRPRSGPGAPGRCADPGASPGPGPQQVMGSSGAEPLAGWLPAAAGEPCEREHFKRDYRPEPPLESESAAF